VDFSPGLRTSGTRCSHQGRRRDTQGSCRRWIAREERRRARNLLLGGTKRRDPAALRYPKNVAADLTPKQVSQLAKVVKEEFGSEKAHV
jgi:hypothetical protein